MRVWNTDANRPIPIANKTQSQLHVSADAASCLWHDGGLAAANCLKIVPQLETCALRLRLELEWVIDGIQREAQASIRSSNPTCLVKGIALLYPRVRSRHVRMGGHSTSMMQLSVFDA